MVKMMNELHPLAITLLWGNAIYHMFMGIFCLLKFEWIASIVNFLYKADLTQDLKNNPNYKFLYVIKPIGAFAITLSLINFAIIFDSPFQLKLVFIRILGLLYFLRLFFRLYNYDLFFKAFKVKKINNYINVSFNIFLIFVTIFTTL